MSNTLQLSVLALMVTAMIFWILDYFTQTRHNKTPEAWTDQIYKCALLIAPGIIVTLIIFVTQTL